MIDFNSIFARRGSARIAHRDEATPLAEVASSFARGRVLEIGFGMGIVHEALHRNENVTGIDVVEWDPKILQTYKNCDCVVTLGDWREVLPPGPYRTIVFDASVRPMPLKDLEPLARLLIGEKDNVLRWIRPPGACRGQVEIISRWSLLHG